MSDDEGPEPNPKLIEELLTVVNDTNFGWSNISDLTKYLRSQPPRSEDAVRVGDLYIRMRDDIKERLDPDSEEYDEYLCRCSVHMMGIAEWYELAIQLDPNNKTAYERLAKEVWWDDGEWPGATLELLTKAREKLDFGKEDDKKMYEEVFQIVKARYFGELFSLQGLASS